MSKTDRFRGHRPLRHLPPSAVPVERGDLWGGLTALVQPQSAMERFHSALMEQTGSPTCYLLASGRAGLTIILLGLKRLSNRPQVIVPAYGCPTVVQAVLEAGLEPVLCDVSFLSLDLDREALTRLVGDQVLAIVSVHLYGLAQDIRDLLAIGQKHGIFVIEDAAQAFGATFQGRMVGTWGDAGLYSLGRGKCIPAGHGGVIVSQDHCAAAIAEVMREFVAGGVRWDVGSLALFAGYGLATRPTGWWFVARSPLNPATDGMKVDALPPIHLRRLSAVQAGIGASILDRLDPIYTVNRRNARGLMAQLTEFDFVTLPRIPSEADPVFLRLPVVLEEERSTSMLFDLLWQGGIGVSRSYLLTLPDLSSGVLATSEQDFPGASRLASCLLTLPTHAFLGKEDLARVVRAFRAVERRTQR